MERNPGCVCSGDAIDGDEVVGDVTDVTGEVPLLSVPLLLSSGGLGGEWDEMSALKQNVNQSLLVFSSPSL
jgi:hypothetical protein